MSIKAIFTPDHARYEGVRPINIYALRLFYLLMAAFVATDAWKTLITHQGPWDRFEAMAFCVWAAYPTLAVLGLIHPLRMLPIMLFTVFYKGLWLIVVAYPLWRAGTLFGSPYEVMTRAFIFTPLLMLAIPWGYVVRNYVLFSKKPVTTSEFRLTPPRGISEATNRPSQPRAGSGPQRATSS